MTNKKKQDRYSEAGVDIDAGNRFVDLIKPIVVITSYSIHYTKLYDYRRGPFRAIETQYWGGDRTCCKGFGSVWFRVRAGRGVRA